MIKFALHLFRVLFGIFLYPGLRPSGLPRAVLWHAFSVLKMNTKQALKQFLLEHKAEVKGMILTEYNEEEVMNGFKEEAYRDCVILPPGSGSI